jgi:DNA-binding NarL/FixJ family response regulator
MRNTIRCVPSKYVPPTPLQVRHQAALKLLEAGQLDPYEALMAVCWPESDRLADEDVPLERRFYSETLKEEIRRRHEAGETIPELAQRTGLPFATVKWLCGGNGRRPMADRERVVELLCQGLEVKVIARMVGVSPKTVRSIRDERQAAAELQLF